MNENELLYVKYTVYYVVLLKIKTDNWVRSGITPVLRRPLKEEEITKLEMNSRIFGLTVI